MTAPHRLLFVWFLVLTLLGCTPPKPTFKGSDVTGIDWGGDIALTAHTGKRVSTADYRGQILILFFGFSNCPDICSPTLAKLAALRKALGPDAAQVQVFFVTVDPKNDTPQQLAGFLPKFDPTFIGLTGSADELTVAAREYKVVAVPSGSSTERFDHSGSIMVKDKAGKLRLIWRNDLSVEDMAHDIRLLDRR
ncbi:MAG TPA: SCO family protein [Burkholderiales bacterium]|jgi:protein SCO1/2